MEDRIRIDILKVLNESRSTAYISSVLRRNYYDTLSFLKELSEEKLIKYRKIGNTIFWEKNNGGKEREKRDNISSKKI